MIGLTVDLGGSHAACAVVNDKQILARSSFAIDEHGGSSCFRAVLDEIVRHFKALCIQTNIGSEDAAGIVFGFPGVVNSKTARVTATNKKFPQACEIDFCTWGCEEMRLPVVLENDARLALLGEQYCGAAQGKRDVVLVMLGTGIGAAAMLDNRALRGKEDRAGCLGGHIPVVMGGRLCTCGNVGCAEAEASTWALPGICRSFPGFSQSRLASIQKIDFAALFHCADHGDIVAQGVLSRCYLVWSTLAIALVHAYSPQMLVFGGAVMARGGDILSALRPYILKHAWTSEQLRIEASVLGTDAALHGTVPRLREAAC